MAEIFRLLNINGYALISVPNHFYYKMRWRILKGKGIILPFHKSNDYDYIHIRFFRSESFEEMIKSSKLIIKEKYYDIFNCLPVATHWPKFFKKTICLKYPDLFSRHFFIKAKKYE